MELEIRRLPSMRLACVRHVGPYWQIGSAFKQLCSWAEEQQLPELTLMALYHDDPRTTPEAELQSDAAAVLPEGQSVTANRGMAVIELPAGAYAVTRHVGPYSELPRTWAEFHARFRESGHRFRPAPSLELYGPMDGVAPEKLVTELYLPVES